MSGPPPASSPPYGYAFEGVVVELARGRLIVDGEDAKAGSLRLKLMQLLCESPRLLITRERLFDAIWPRQVVSDEALTKLIGRLREALGPYGDRLVTVRGLGLRLDASVEVLTAPPDAGETPPIDPVQAVPGEAPPTESARPSPDIATPSSESLRPIRRFSLNGVAGLVLALGLIVVAGVWLLPASSNGSDRIIVDGMGLTAADVDAGAPGTHDLLRKAEYAWNEGDIERARAMLLALHQSDRQSAIPGTLYAFWSLTSNVEQGQRIAEEAKQRLHDRSTPYARLLAAFVEYEAKQDGKARPALSALVEMRASAWRLQLALGHRELARRHERLALAALNRIPLEGVPSNILTIVLSDRASLGDVDAIARIVADGALTDAPADRAIVLGRIEWARGNLDAAIAYMDEAAALAESSNAHLNLVRAREYATVFAYAAGRSDTVPRIQQTIQTQQAQSLGTSRSSGFKALLAEYRLDEGDRAAAAELLEDAGRQADGLLARAGLEIFNARLGLVLPAGHFLSAEQRGAFESATHNGALQLLDAWTAYAGDDAATAARLLEQARSLGINRTYFQEDATLLGTLLSRRIVPACRPDPPYPNYLRFSACRALSRLEAEQAAL